MLQNNTFEAYEYLNSSLMSEIVHDCQNQKEFTSHLSELIDSRKAKYHPFYEKIGMEMPDMLEDLGLIFRAILIIGMLALMIFLS